MIQSITWKQFGMAAVSAGLLYYLIILLQYYRQELIAFFKSRGKRPGEAPGEPPVNKTDQQVFGAIRIDEAEMDVVKAEELDFAAFEPDTTDLPENGDTKNLLLGEVADLMQELKVLLRVTKDTGDTKENFLMLFRLLVSKHPRIPSAAYGKSIAISIMDDSANLPFELTQTELEQEFTNSIRNQE